MLGTERLGLRPQFNKVSAAECNLLPRRDDPISVRRLPDAPDAQRW